MSPRSKLSLLFVLGALPLCAQRRSELQIPKAIPAGSTVVIGFLGGFEHWDDPHRGVRKVALDLRSRAIPNLYVDTIENRHQPLALKLLKQSHNLRIILYGQSWGGAAVIKTARQLKQRGMPVELTVQVDSVGLHDTLIPANVRAAANLYQHDPLTIVGAQEIRPEDPTRTRIIENTRLSYLFTPMSKTETSWARRALGGSHAKLEADENVWRHVEDLILAAVK